MASPLIVLTASSTEASEWKHSVWQQMMSAAVPVKLSNTIFNKVGLHRPQAQSERHDAIRRRDYSWLQERAREGPQPDRRQRTASPATCAEHSRSGGYRRLNDGHSLFTSGA